MDLKEVNVEFRNKAVSFSKVLMERLFLFVLFTSAL